MVGRGKSEHCFSSRLHFALGLFLLASSSFVAAQGTGGLDGVVLDPSGAVVPKAKVTITDASNVFNATSRGDGIYNFQSVPIGAYAVTVEAQGFVLPNTNVVIEPGHIVHMNLSLEIATEEQNVQVGGENSGVSVSPEENADAIVLHGSDMDALSDDPGELENELQALAGPAAGPNGGQIYIDGFSGGQIPPKSSIREIRINQNPFSAEFDRLGYGRIEILTKPGTDKLSGYIMGFGLLSALNTANPLVKEQPSYYGYSLPATISGPLSKRGSYFVGFFHNHIENQSIVDAIDPLNTSTTVNQAVSNPLSTWMIAPRIDFQLGSSNTLSVRDSFQRAEQSNNGIGALVLPAQSYDMENSENALQASDTVIVNQRLLDEIRFQWRRIRGSQNPNSQTPAVIVQGAFTDGGSSSGVVQDHQDIFEFQNSSTLAVRSHTIRFGARLRAYRDANYSTSGANGTYIFQSLSEYAAATPDQYQVTTINHPLAKALLFDAALFYQDDWRMKPNATLSYGLRYEGQNRIRDHADWGPRLAVAWAPGKAGRTAPQTILRAGYGWFYNRFTVPGSFSSASGVPYVIPTIHQNGINEQNFIFNDPGFFDPAATTAPGSVGTVNASISTLYTIDPHFRAALDMQGGIGIDERVRKSGTLSITYLFTRGIHQYLSNNVSAPQFDPSTYTITGPPPSLYDYQFQSEGLYNQQQIIVSANLRFRSLSVHGVYTFNDAKSDTNGVNSFPSVAADPHLDYGRPGFDIRNRLTILGTYSARHRISVNPMLIAQSGTPFNITIGDDLTDNNQFNARPTYGTCGSVDVVQTQYGCLDTNPVGKGEKIIPYGVGNGPANVVFNLRVSKAFGIGPRVATPHGTTAGNVGFNVGNSGLGGTQSRTRLDAEAPRRYTFTLIGNAYNLLNIVNLGAPNGVLRSTLFGTSQSLAGGPFSSLSPGNRAVLLQASLNF